MAAVAGDVTNIQDEELLRRMWQETEDFGRKKEIRARMYKLREQRLKEFYTTGEVLSDVLTTGTAALLDNIRHSTQQEQQVIQKTASYTTSSGGTFATHADSIADEGFMTLKSKEIRDSESPTRDFHRRQQMNQEDSERFISQEIQNMSQNVGGETYWKVSEESSRQDFKSSGRTGDDGEMVVNTSSRSEHRNMTGGSDTDGLTCTSQVVATEGTERTPSKELAIKESADAANADTSVVVSEHGGGRTVVSSTSKKWSSSQSSQREERITTSSSSSSKTSSTSRVVHKDSGFSDDFQSKDISEANIRKDSLIEQAGSRKSSLTADQGSRKSSLASDQGSRKSSLTTPSGKYRITQRSSTTEVPFLNTEGGADASNVTVTTSKSGDTMTIDINVANSQDTSSKVEEISSKIEEKSTLDEKRIMTELQKLDTFLSTQKSTSTPTSPGDAGGWTAVSEQQTGRDESEKTEKFIFHLGHDQDTADVINSNTFINQEKTTIEQEKTLKDKTTTLTDEETASKIREPSPEKKPVTSTTPTEPKKGIMKQPSQDKIDSKGQYITTYTEHFTNKRISVETDRNHEAFAKSLRSSPEKVTPSSTRSSSKVSLDRSSPTRNYRNKTSADSSLASLNATSPTRKSPGRASPDKSSSPTKSVRDRTSPRRSSPEKRQSSPEKSTSTSPSRASPDKTTRVRGAPETTSPTRGTAKDKPVRRTSSARNSPEKDARGTSPDKLSVSKTPSRRVSAGDKPRTDVTSTISVSSTIKEKRRLSSGASRNATKKRSSTPGASPTHDERQSRPRSRGSSRSATDSDGSESRTYTRDTEEETRQYQQSVMDKEDFLMSATSKEIDVDQGSLVTIEISNLQREISPRPSDGGPSTQPNVDVTYEITVTDENGEMTKDMKTKSPVERGTSPMKSSPKPRESPAVTKLARDRSPEYSSEGSLANELPRRGAGVAPHGKPLRGGQESQDSPDSSPERASFKPIKQFRTSPEVKPDSHAPKPTNVSPTSAAKSPTKSFTTKRGLPPADSSDEIEISTNKEPVKPDKPISTRPGTNRQSPHRPNASPAILDEVDKSSQKSPIIFKFTKPTPGDQSPSRRFPSTTDKSRVPEVTRRSPTPESPSRRRGRPSDSSSVSPCSSPERQSDRENMRSKALKKASQKKKPTDTDKSPRDRSTSPEKMSTKKKPDSRATPKDSGRRSESPIKATPVRRGSLPRRLSKEAVKPQYSDSSPERDSPERRAVRPSQKTTTNRVVTTVKVQPSPARPSSIPRAGRKTVTAEVKPFERKPSWSKTLRNETPVKEIHKTTKTIVLGRVSAINRSVSAPRPSSLDRKKPEAQPTPERSTSSTRPARNRPEATPVKSAFVRTNSKPTSTPQQSVPKKQELPSPKSSKSTPASTPQKPRDTEDQSPDRSSSVSSPETVKRLKQDKPSMSEQLTSSSDAEDKPVSPSFVTGVVKSFIKVNTATEDYFSDEYEDVLDETPPDEFLVDDDSPVRLTSKSSSPSPAKKEPVLPIPFKQNAVNKNATPEKTKSRPVTSTPTARNARPKSQDIKKTPVTSEPTKMPLKTTPNKPLSKPEQPRTFRSVATVETRITRSNSDKNVIRRQSPSPSGVVNRRQTSKPELPVSRLAEKTSSVATRTGARQQVSSVTSVTTRLTTAKTTTSKTTPVKTTLVGRKSTPVDTVRKTPQKSPTKVPEKKHNGVVKKLEYDSSSDEEGLPDKCPSLIDTDDEEYSRELEELRREEESQYASRVTAREDALLSICQDKLKTSRDSLTIVDIRLKSSRESSPDGRSPRFADRVSEPETDDDFARKPDAVRFQRPVLHPNPLDEETDEDSQSPRQSKAAPKVYPKGILTSPKVSPSSKPADVVEYPMGEVDESQPKRPSEYLKNREFTDKTTDDEEDFVEMKSQREYPPQKPLQVTDLDASDNEESLRLSMSVSDRVTHFLETTKAQSSSPVPQAAEVPTRLSNLDSPSAVNKARAMFETIATTQQQSPPKERQIDILSRPSVFEARRNGPWAKPEEKREEKIADKTPARLDLSTRPRSDDYPSHEEIRVQSKVSVDVTTKSSSTNRKPSIPKDKSPREKSPTGKPNRTPSSSPERPASSRKDSCPRDKSPAEKKSDTFSRRKPSLSPERPTNKAPRDTYPRDKSPTGKTTINDISNRRQPQSPESKTTPRDTYPRDKSPPGKTTNDTLPRRKPSTSPERPSTRDKSPPGKISTDTFTRRKSTDRSTDFTTRPEKQTSPQEKQISDKTKPILDKYASFPSQTRGSRIKVDEAVQSPTKTTSTPSSPVKSPENRKPSKDELPDIMDILAIRRGSIPKKESVTATRKESVPKKDTSPVRKESLPRTPSQDSPRRTSPTRQVKESPRPSDVETSPRRDSIARDKSPTDRVLSPTRKPTSTPTRKDSLPKDSKRIVSLEQSSTRGSGVFGVALRSTTTPITTPPRRRSDAKPKTEDEDENIEDIFDVYLLEAMLEKAVGYDKRRRIRAQIRIVRRQLEISTTDVTKTTTMTTSKEVTEQTNRSTATVELSSRRRTSPTRPKPQDEPRRLSTVEAKQQERKPSTTEAKLQERKSSTTEAKPQERRPSDAVSNRKRSPSPQKSSRVLEEVGSQRGSSNFVKKLSKTEMTIELKTSSPTVVKTTTPVKKWSIGEASQEAGCPVTSSYGVGPTDENGRPLFGLRALRKSHNNQSQSDFTEPKQPICTEPEVEAEPVRDRSGRPLFGGLRALQVKSSTSSTTTVRRDSQAEEDEENRMPEQPESPQLRELVTRHEQRVRATETSQPLQKPKAKLRDSFVLPTSTTSKTDAGVAATETTRSASHRADALRSLIQKHESIAKDEELSLGSRPGILKKARDDVVSESHSRSMTVTSRGTMRSDGTVSLTRDVIKGETIQRGGEEPVTRVSRTQQRYDTPRDQPLAIEEVTPRSTSTSPERYCGTSDERKFVSASSLRKSSTDSTTSKSRRNDDDVRSTSRYTSSKTVTTSKQVFSGDERRSSQAYSVDYNDDDESDGYQGSTQIVEVSSKSSSPRATPDRVIPGYNSRETKSFTTESSRRRSSTPLDEGRQTPTRTITRGNSIRALQEKFQQAAGSPVSSVKQPMSLDAGVTTTSSRSQTTSQTDASSGPRSFINNQTRVTGVQDILTRMRNADHVVESGDTIEDTEARALLNKFLGAQVILQGMEPLVTGSKQGSSLVTQVERQMEPLVKVSQQSAALVRQVERQRVMATSTSGKVPTTGAVSNGRAENIEDIWDEAKLRRLLDDCTDYEGRRKIRARLRVVMAEQKACSDIVSAALADQAAASAGDAPGAMELRTEQDVSQATTKTSSVEGNVTTTTEVTTKTSSFSSSAVGSRVVTKAPIAKAVSPFAKFQQLDRQNSKSAPNSPKTPGEPAAGPLFKFTDPQLCRSASTVKDKLLYWCQVKTKEYKNIKIDNFSTSWSNGLAFCALIHHFLPTAFDYDALKPEERRKNFELAFQIADDKAGIAPLLDVEDMVMMRKPDWKCVFTYVQSIYRRFKDED